MSITKHQAHIDNYLKRLKEVNDKHIAEITELKQKDVDVDTETLKKIQQKNKHHAEMNKMLKMKLIHKIKNIPKTKDFPKKNKSALLIGIDYIGTEYKLDGCINDINNISNLLRTKYQYSDITTLTDNTDVKPTYNNIIQTMKTWFLNSKPGDTLFFQYSGHGSYTKDTSGDELNSGRDEMIIPIDFQPITDDDLNLVIKYYLPQNVKLFALFDSCYSGTILDLKYNYLDSLNYNSLTDNKHIPLLNKNIIMISGCTDNQTSADAYVNKTYQGAMTWSFLQTLNSNSNVSWSTFLQNMRNLLKTNKYSQIPQLSSSQKIDINSLISF